MARWLAWIVPFTVAAGLTAVACSSVHEQAVDAPVTAETDYWTGEESTASVDHQAEVERLCGDDSPLSADDKRKVCAGAKEQQLATQSIPGSDPYVQRPAEEVERESTIVDFNSGTIEGELTKPEGEYLTSRKKTDYNDDDRTLKELTVEAAEEEAGQLDATDLSSEEKEQAARESERRITPATMSETVVEPPDSDSSPAEPSMEANRPASEGPGFFDAVGDGLSAIGDGIEDVADGIAGWWKDATAPPPGEPPPTPPWVEERPPFRDRVGTQQRQAISEMGSSGEELWVIARAEARARPPQDDPWAPGSGELRTQLEGEDRVVPLPLKHTDVQAHISGYIASVQVKQQYHNPFDQKIEAVYVFPLPQDAAVSEFVMVIGDRRIRGIIRERHEAERIYREARRAGHVASLLTQERPNVFTQRVANIEPNKAIDIDLTYYNALPYRDGSYVFAFPMVVGPRFNPPGSTEGIGAVARGAHGTSGQATEVSYLKPGERSGHDLSLTVALDAGVSVEQLASSTHEIDVEHLSKSEKRISLTRAAVIPNKDFVLRYRVAGNRIKSALLTHEDERGGYFTLMLQPPASLKRLPRTPREMVFVLDCSGSMSGVPLDKAKRAVRRVLTLMEPDDTFQIIRFSSNASQLGPRPVPATRKNIKRGLRYLDSLNSDGGTMMIEGVKAALDFPHEEGKLRIVSFMTDGYIGNEADILNAIHHRLGPSRLFAFGVGSSTNRYLLERMAKIGRGAVAYVELNQDAADEAVDAFYERIAYPALADIEIDWGHLEVEGVYPSRMPDLHVGRPVVLTGRFRGDLRGHVEVTGRVGGEQLRFAVPVEPASRRWPAIAQIWARMKISDLADRATFDEDVGPLVADIKETALAYGLMSKWTAYVAVDSSRVTEMEYGVTVPQPVPLPEGVRYDTTVTDPSGGASRGGELAGAPAR